MSSNVICSCCDVVIHDNEFIKCVKCEMVYHYSCAGFAEATFRNLRSQRRESWLCKDCKKGGASSTSTPRTSPERNNRGKKDEKNFSGIDMERVLRHIDEKMDRLEDRLSARFETSLQRLHAQLEETTRAVQFVSERMDEFERDYAAVPTALQQLQRELEAERAERRREGGDLRQRLDRADQLARSCNVELQNVTERKAENLVRIVQAVGEAVKVPIPVDNIVSVHRVPRNGPAEGKPRNIVVKLSTRPLRDSVIAAARRVRGITTEAIGVTGTVQHVYVNEHLTLQTKALFRSAKEKARQSSYKHVWIKNGTIHVRQEDLSQVLFIKTEEDLQNIKK